MLVLLLLQMILPTRPVVVVDAFLIYVYNTCVIKPSASSFFNVKASLYVNCLLTSLTIAKYQVASRR